LVALPDKPLPYGQLLTDDLIRAMVTRIAEHLHPEKVVVFGSYATGTPTADSDLDLLVVMDSDQPAYKRGLPIRRLFNPQPCPMDVLVYTPREVEYWNGTVNHIITEAFESGRVYYKRKAA
jgi:predicted nucleotidyltransferase